MTGVYSGLSPISRSAQNQPNQRGRGIGEGQPARYCVLTLLVSQVSFAQAARPVQKEVAGRVGALLTRMTLEEKTGQLTQIGGVAIIPGAPKPEDTIRKNGVGSILWLSETAARRPSSGLSTSTGWVAGIRHRTQPERFRGLSRLTSDLSLAAGGLLGGASRNAERGVRRSGVDGLDFQ